MSKEKPTEFRTQDERDLEEYGVWVKSGPEDIDEGADEVSDFSIEHLDREVSSGEDENELTDDEEDLLAELDGKQGLAENETPYGGSVDIDLDTDFDVDEELPDLVDEDDAADAEQIDDSTEWATDGTTIEQLSETESIDLEQISLPDEEPFPEFNLNDSEDDDRQDGSEGIPEPVLGSGTGLVAMDDNSSPQTAQLAEVLQSVQAELGDIKREIAEIRSEVAGLRAARADSSLAPDKARPSLEGETAEGGFFDEPEDEEDETIALTGDELDNILNTAQFVEEPAPEATADLEEMGAADEDTTLGPLDLDSIEESDQNAAVMDELGIEDEAVLDLDQELASDEDIIPIDLGDQAPAEAAETEVETPAAPAEEESGFDFTLDDLSFEDEPSEEDADAELDVADLDEIPPGEELEGEPTDGQIAPDEDDVLELDELSLDIDGNLEDEQDAELEELTSDEPEDLQTELTAEEQRMRAAPEEAFGPTGEHEVDALAQMDIDSELAGIDELSDTPEQAEFQPATDELHGVRFGVEDSDTKAAGAQEPETAGAANRGSQDMVGSGKVTDRSSEIPGDLREEIRSVLHYMDQLLEALPEEKIQEFAESEHFEVYKRLFEELGLEE